MNVLTLSSIFCYWFLYFIIDQCNLIIDLFTYHLAHRQFDRKRTSFVFVGIYDDLSFV